MICQAGHTRSVLPRQNVFDLVEPHDWAEFISPGPSLGEGLPRSTLLVLLVVDDVLNFWGGENPN